MRVFIPFLDLMLLKTEQHSPHNETFTIVDPYANFRLCFRFWFKSLNAGVRINNHNVYGSNFVYNINPSFTLTI